VAERLVLLTQYFYPEMAATAQLLTDLAVELTKRNMAIAAYAAQPTYHYRDRLSSREIYQGVHIRRLFSTRFGKRSQFGRLADGLSFCLAVFFCLSFSRDRAPLLIVSNPPFLGWVGWLAGVLLRRKYVLLVHDVYPDVAIRLGYLKERGLVARIWRALNRRMYSRAAAVIVLGERVKQVVEQHIENSATPVEVIHNWADGQFIMPRCKEENWFAQEHGLTGKTVVLYSGNLGLFHDLETLIEAAERLKMRDDIVFLFIGEGGKKEKLMQMAQERGLENVKFLPYQPREYLPYSLTAGDISVVTLERGTEGLCTPSKLYAYLAAGQAILALVGENSEIADILEECGCGLRVDQGDITGAVDALKRWLNEPALLEKMKASARRCFERRFTLEQAVDRYYEILSRL